MPTLFQSLEYVLSLLVFGLVFVCLFFFLRKIKATLIIQRMHTLIKKKIFFLHTEHDFMVTGCLRYALNFKTTKAQNLSVGKGPAGELIRASV